MKNKGFTLIELLAVILILGIIALIAIPTVNNVIKQARKGALESTGNQIVNSTEQFFTMCDLKGGYDKNENKCPDDLRGTLYSSSELSDVIGVKGDFPDISDFVVYKKNPNGTAAVVYRKDSFACSNQVDEAGNISYKYTGINNSDGVKCTEKKISGSGNVLLQTDGTKHVMKSYQVLNENADYDSVMSEIIDEDFRADDIRDTVYEIKFINHVNIPDTVSNDKKWDVSEVQDGSIMAWLEPIEEGSSLNTLFIGSKGNIYANPLTGYLFSIFQNLTNIEFSNFYTDDSVNMKGMFLGCDSLASVDVSNFNTSKVMDMSFMFSAYTNYVSNVFYYISNLEKIVGIENFDTSNVKTMESMFHDAYSLLELDLKKWDVSKVENFASMFDAALKLRNLDVSTWKTSNAKDMSFMFWYVGNETTNIYLDLSNFDTSNVTDMCGMFGGAGVESLDVSNFDTHNVTEMGEMFTRMDNIKELDLSNFNTSRVENFSYIFDEDPLLEKLDISSFSFEGTTSLSYMLAGDNKVGDLDLSSWDTSHITDFQGFFGWSSYDNLSDLISQIDTSSAINMSEMFYNVRNKTIDITGLNTSNVKDMSHMFGSVWFYNNKIMSESDAYLENIIGIENLNTSNVTNMSGMFTKVKIKNLDLSKWSTSKVTNMSYMFYKSEMENLDISNWSNNLVTNMTYIFSKMFNLKTINLTNFKTPKVTNMSYMFSGDYRLSTLDVSSFNTSLVTNMSYMFENTLGLTKIDMTGWNTAKVTNMSYMFAGGAPLGDENWQYTKAVNYIGLDNFNTSNVTNFTRMFYRYGGTSLSLPSFNTLKATNMQDMFRTTKLLTLDISSFDTSNVANGKDMFIYNYDIVTIYVGTGWNTSKMIDSPTMFSNCTKLVGAVKFDATKKGISMANYTTGYLTLKS